MQPFSWIDTEESIRRKKLVFYPKLNDWIDVAFAIFTIAAITTFSFILLYKEKPSSWNGNEIAFESVYCFFAFIVAPYVLYRLATRNRLYIIPTQASFEKNKQLLREYAKEFDYSLRYMQGDCLVMNDDNAFVEGHLDSRRCYIFILDDQTIYYGSVKFQRKGGWPSLFHHWIILRDIRKRIHKRDDHN